MLKMPLMKLNTLFKNYNPSVNQKQEDAYIMQSIFITNQANIIICMVKKKETYNVIMFTIFQYYSGGLPEEKKQAKVISIPLSYTNY